MNSLQKSISGFISKALRIYVKDIETILDSIDCWFILDCVLFSFSLVSLARSQSQVLEVYTAHTTFFLQDGKQSKEDHMTAKPFT